MRRILHTGDYYYVRESYQSNNTQSLQTSEKYCNRSVNYT